MRAEDREALMELFRFGPEDLIYNRRGLISPQQQSSLRRENLPGPLIFGLAGAALTVYLGMTGVTEGRSGPVVVGLVLGSMLIGIGAFLFWLIESDARRGVVKVARGQVEIRPARLGFAVTIAGEQLGVLYDLRGLLSSDETYAFYFTPRNRGIVAIEQIDTVAAKNS